MTVEDFLSFRKENGFLEKVEVWKNGGENLNKYKKIAEFNPEFYEVISKEVLDLEVENFDIDIEYGSDGGTVLLVFVNQENSTKKIQELFNR